MSSAYEARSYAEILADMKAYAAQRWPGWNVDAKTIGNIILECWSDQIEKLEYRLDQIVNELFPDTAIEYRSVLRWARMVGYPVQCVTPAEATLTLSLLEPLDTAFTVPKGTTISTPGPDPIPFQVVADVRVAPGQTTATATVRQTEDRTDDWVGTGKPAQVYKTGWGPVWLDSLEVLVDGQRWNRVTDWLSSGPSSLDYMAELTADHRLLILFGDGTFGKCPGSGAEILARYKISRGSTGNVPAGTITEVASVLYDDRGFLVDLYATNAAAATNGTDQETLGHIRDSIPAWISTSTTCITKTDYERAACSVVGVERALCHGHDQDPEIPALDIWVYIVPVGGGVPGAALLESVRHELTVRRSKVNSIQVVVKPALYLTANVTAQATAGFGYDKLRVKEGIEAAIRAFFAYDRLDPDQTLAVDFGKPLYVSQLTSFVMGRVSGIANLTFPGLEDLRPASNVIPALGEVTVSVV